MPDHTRQLRDYARAITANLSRGDATEHTHRTALKNLLESVRAGAVATNEPQRIECGAPDYIVTSGVTTIGYVEAKDVEEDLTKAEQTDQLKRYLASLPNIILTDYVEFRWYTDGLLRASAKLGMVDSSGAIKTTSSSLEQVAVLLAKFMEHKSPSAGTAKELAVRMAHLARMIRDVTARTFEHEKATGTLHGEYQAFKEVLLPDLTPEQFADMFAQTVAYGLFAAREGATPGERFTRRSAAYMLPKTNPFLRRVFLHIAGPDLDERIAWIVDDLAQVLADAEMDAILEDFGNRVRKEDPVVHFYETFLAEYNPKMREMRGVYYTPEPVVSYIVRSVDYLLKTKFDKPLGLADPDVLILDPACGTGTFLFYVVKLIYERMVEEGQAGGWNDYVEKHLLPRLFGFELLMAPYAIAHLKLGLLLEETGYEFKSDQRLGIYLTNSLEEAAKEVKMLPFAEYITEEANAAAEVKREKPIMVVLGNPPYSAQSANRSEHNIQVASEERWVGRGAKRKLTVVMHPTPVTRRVKTWIGKLLQDYYRVNGQPLEEKNPKLLQDDYVKFIRFGQWRIERTGYGILAFISNNGYLDNPTFKGMRQNLMNGFSEISILDLHGNTRKRETSPDGSPDENVFDIQQGVAIGLFVKEAATTGPVAVRHADLWGLRKTSKYPSLMESDISSTPWRTISPLSPHYLFIVQNTEFLAEYEEAWPITNVMACNSTGVKTHRDEFVFDFEKSALVRRIADFLDPKGSVESIRAKYLSSGDRLDLAYARGRIAGLGAIPDAIVECLYRPFDVRPLFYHDAVVDRSRTEVMRHLIAGANVGLVFMRQVALDEPYSHFGVANGPVDNRAFYSNKGTMSLAPLYLYPDRNTNGDLFSNGHARHVNLNPDFVADMAKRLSLSFVSDGKGDLQETFGPEDVFDYIYAVFHCPTYRTRYAEFLKIDFPRVPLTSNVELFRRLVDKGAELVSLHLMESPKLDRLITKFPVSGSDEVEKVRYDDANGRAHINSSQYFEGVAPQVWEFHVGGYHVLDKWLKDRKGRKLTWEDQQHYQKIVVALTETMRLMREIDEVIPSWPIS